MAKPKAVLFDLDGTLLDTARDLGNALNFVLNEHGFPLKSYEEFRPVASNGSQGLLELGFGDALADFDVEQLRKSFLDHYNNNICVDTVPFNGIEALITFLEDQAMPWGIVTNKPGWLTDALVPQFTSLKSSAITVSGDTLEKRKPHPEPLLFAAKNIAIPPADIWYVGDAERDIQSAKRAGMFSVVAEYGYIAESDDPESWDADLHVASASQLLTRLLHY